MVRTNIDFIGYIEKLNQEYPGYFAPEHYAAKEVILKQDKRYRSLYIIKKGITKCYFSDENGKDFIQEFLGEGMEFGELEVFSGNLSFCSIEAVSNVDVYKISHERYNELLVKDPVFNRLVIKAMAVKIGYKAPRHSFQQLYSIEENISRLEESFPSYNEIFSKNDIANYLGITTRSLNRIIKG